MALLSPFSTAVEMLEALRSRQISSLELLELHLQQVERFNPAINALVIFDADRARQDAQQADARLARGEIAPLLGLPFTVKDWIEAGGWRSTGGDPDFAALNYTAQRDGRVVERLRQAGAVLFAKSNMAPWGGDWKTENAVFGRTLNPWDAERTPGGSTGGGAAALAAGLTPLEIGNDIGGSVRIPTAFCGVYGHKTSDTAWPRSGQTPDRSGLHLPLPVGLAVMGPLARSAPDLALALDVAAGPDQGEETAWRLEIPPARHSRLEDFRVAVLPSIPWLPVQTAISDALERLAQELRRRGVKVAEAQPEAFGDLQDFYHLYHKLSIAETSSPLPMDTLREIAAWAREEAARRGDPIFIAGAQAFEAHASDTLRWYAEREKYRHALREFFREWDVLLAPVCMVTAFRHDQAPEGTDIDDLNLSVDGVAVPYRSLGVYPSLATLTGHPATAFPAGQAGSGLPVGLQAIGPYLEDHTPIRFAGLAADVLGGFIAPPDFKEA